MVRVSSSLAGGGGGAAPGGGEGMGGAFYLMILFPNWRKAGQISHSYERRLKDYYGIDVVTWALICHFYLNCCVKCGKYKHIYYNLSVDHVSGDFRNKGIDDLQPLCQNPCNTSKGQRNIDYRWDKGELMAKWVRVNLERMPLMERANIGNYTLEELLKMEREPEGVGRSLSSGTNGKIVCLEQLELLDFS